MCQVASCLSKVHAQHWRGGVFQLLLITIDVYGMVRPIEGRGFEEKECCMQQKRCTIFMPHAMFQHQGVPSETEKLFVRE
jgi:hypothetical protein